MKTLHSIILLTSSLILFSTPGLSKEYTSTSEATELIELYTSEGCSSCPPADKWLSGLKANPQLFKKIIPLSFHVDYWDQLGWKDRFAKKQYSNRQYQHQSEGNLSQVYTPGIMVNNEEWRNWRLGKLFHWPDSSNKVGILKVNYQAKSQQLNVSFAPELATENQLLINVAILGMGLTNNVKSGENRGLKLSHDFVVLSHAQHLASFSQAKKQHWQISMSPIPVQGQKQTALVVWLSTTHSQDVIQATGGYL